MKTIYTLLVLSIPFFITFTSLAQQPEGIEYQVVPTAYSGTAGTATFLGPLANSQRTYQLLIDENQLTNVVGKDLKGISWRIPTSATANWPAAEVTYTNYDIYLSPGVDPANRDLTFINNVAGPQIQVRSGSLVIPADSYTFGNNPNSFGSEITFNNSYLYSGGHLLIEIRHTGFIGTSRSTDALSTSTAGYLTDFSACWTGNYAGTAGSQGNFSVVRLSADDPVPVELTSFTVSLIEKNVELNWTTASETNNLGFEIERRNLSLNPIQGEEIGNEWEKIGFAAGFGTTTETKSYSYIDSKVSGGNYSYRLKQIDFDGRFEYSNEVNVEVVTLSVYSLEQNYPNPFNPSTNISFNIAEAGIVKISLFNLLGQEVKSLLNVFKEAGTHTITFDASSLTSGVYFYKLETPQFSQTRKMILNK
ncbi:MAG TPA: T9SS type A sorting domain-containing protein [Ignavibacteriaceae bacterium]|nr:T9SS type A sorting domain-containing protein [Ignavibacteriaceae bacterium]